MALSDFDVLDVAADRAGTQCHRRCCSLYRARQQPDVLVDGPGNRQPRWHDLVSPLPRDALLWGQDCKIIKTKAKLQLYAAEKLAAEAEGTADAYLRLALWCVEKGLLTQADQALGAAYQADAGKRACQANGPARAVSPRHGPALSGNGKGHAREFVKNDEMKVARSRHFILMHDTADEKDLGNVSRVLWRRE